MAEQHYCYLPKQTYVYRELDLHSCVVGPLDAPEKIPSGSMINPYFEIGFPVLQSAFVRYPERNAVQRKYSL